MEPLLVFGGEPVRRDQQAEQEIPEFLCTICSRNYKSQAALNMHKSRIHGVPGTGDPTIRCREVNCRAKFKTIGDLRVHLTTTHMLQFKTISFSFTNFQAFQRWKTQVEHTECICFVMKKSKRNPNETQRFFYCKKSLSDNTQPKAVDCTAQLFVKEDLRTSKVTVSGCLTHYGHSMTTKTFADCLAKRSRIKEGGAVGEQADVTALKEQLVAIYDLATTKIKQKSVDKICGALKDLHECIKDYDDEEDDTLPGLEETQAWRRTAAREEAEQGRQNL